MMLYARPTHPTVRYLLGSLAAEPSKFVNSANVAQVPEFKGFMVVFLRLW